MLCYAMLHYIVLYYGGLGLLPHNVRPIGPRGRGVAIACSAQGFVAFWKTRRQEFAKGRRPCIVAL